MASPFDGFEVEARMRCSSVNEERQRLESRRQHAECRRSAKFPSMPQKFAGMLLSVCRRSYLNLYRKISIAPMMDYTDTRALT